MLETLGVAIHAIDLSKIRVASSVAVIGAGPVGLLLTRLAVLAGAAQVFTFDKFDWRLRVAEAWGASYAYNVDDCDPTDVVMDLTGGRGVDVAIEAAWSDHSVRQAAEMARYGGRLVIVGIAPDDRLQLQHSVARRKGLTIIMSRRMKHTYPRAIQLAASGRVQLEELVFAPLRLGADGGGLREQRRLRAWRQQGDLAGGILAGCWGGEDLAHGDFKAGQHIAAAENVVAL